MMPLYVKNTVSFGAVLATLIATAGDSAFVTMTQAPKDFALITVLCLIVGAVSGTISDRTGLSDWVKARSSKRVVPNLKEKHEEAERLLDGQCCDAEGTCRSCNLVHIGHEEGDEIDMILHHQKPLDMTSLGYRITHHAYVVFWVVLAVGFVFGILDLMQVDLNAIPRIPNAGTMIGVSGTAVTIIYTVASKNLCRRRATKTWSTSSSLSKKHSSTMRKKPPSSVCGCSALTSYTKWPFTLWEETRSSHPF